MAVYIIMLKEYEDENIVIYKYGPNENTTGKIGFDKKNRKILDIEEVEDNMSKDFYFKRAAQKLAIVSQQCKNGFEKRLIVAS